MDERSFETAVRFELKKWQSAALRVTGNCADADDAVQAALIDAWKKLETLEEGPAFSAFVYGIVIHKAVDIVRSDAARHSRERAWKAPEPRRRHCELYEGIASLPETYAQAVVALLENDMKYDAAAKELAWTEKLLYSRMHRAKRLLSEILKKDKKT